MIFLLAGSLNFVLEAYHITPSVWATSMTCSSQNHLISAHFTAVLSDGTPLGAHLPHIKPLRFFQGLRDRAVLDLKDLPLKDLVEPQG